MSYISVDVDISNHLDEIDDDTLVEELYSRGGYTILGFGKVKENQELRNLYNLYVNEETRGKHFDKELKAFFNRHLNVNII